MEGGGGGTQGQEGGEEHLGSLDAATHEVGVDQAAEKGGGGGGPRSRIRTRHGSTGRDILWSYSSCQ